MFYLIARIASCICFLHFLCINSSEPNETSSLKTQQAPQVSISPAKQAEIDAAIQKKKREYCLKDCCGCCFFGAGLVIPCMTSIGMYYGWWQCRKGENDRRKQELDNITQNILERK